MGRAIGTPEGACKTRRNLAWGYGREEERGLTPVPATRGHLGVCRESWPPICNVPDPDVFAGRRLLDRQDKRSDSSVGVPHLGPGVPVAAGPASGPVLRPGAPGRTGR